MAGLEWERGDPGSAFHHYQMARHLIETDVEKNPRDKVRLTELASVLSGLGRMQAANGRYSEALATLERAVAIGQRSDRSDGVLASAALTLARLSQSRGDLPRAIEQCQIALAHAQKIHGSGDPQLAPYLDCLAGLYRKSGDVKKANELVLDADFPADPFRR
jgi:tetratricopeptide (TPR) repeat protein